MSQKVKTAARKMSKSKSLGSDNGKKPKHSGSGFLGDLKNEFRKITWTEKEELATYTKIVVASTFALGMTIYFMDLIIQGGLTTLAFLVRLITG